MNRKYKYSFADSDTSSDEDNSETYSNFNFFNMNQLPLNFNAKDLLFGQNPNGLFLKKQMDEQIAKMSSKVKPFNSKPIINFLNQAFGKTFIETYIASDKGTWAIEEVEKGDFSAKLKGLLIPNRADCQWYQTKLIKAGVKLGNIHFEPVKGKIKDKNKDKDKSKDNKDKVTEKYQIKISHIQSIEIKVPNPAYQQFIEEMDQQIENIGEASKLLQLEQQGLTLNGQGSCIRAIQNRKKIEDHQELMKIFKTAKEKANSENYQAIKEQVYQEAEEDYGYTKTESQNDALLAYYMRTWS